MFSLFVYEFLRKHGSIFKENVAYTAKYRQLRENGEFTTTKITIPEEGNPDQTIYGKMSDLYERAVEKSCASREQTTRSRFQYSFLSQIPDFEKALDPDYKTADYIKDNLGKAAIYLCQRYINNRHYLGVNRTHHNDAELLMSKVREAEDANAIMQAVEETCDILYRQGSSSDLLKDLQYLRDNLSLRPDASKKQGIFCKIGSRIFSLTGLRSIMRQINAEIRSSAELSFRQRELLETQEMLYCSMDGVKF